MRKLITLVNAAIILAAGASGCADSSVDPVAPTAPQPGGASFLREPAGLPNASLEPSPFVCLTSVRTPAGPYAYSYGRFYLHFTQGIEKANSVTRFRYSVPSTTGEVMETAVCVIPSTRGAIMQTARYFHLSPDQIVRDDPGESVLMCGTEKDPCQIKGVTGTATPVKPNQCDPTLHFGCETGSSGGSSESGLWGESWGETTGGGESSEPESSSETAFSDGPIAWAACVLALAGSTMSVLDVAAKFQIWHTAWQDALGAYDLWRATIENNASPEIQQLYEYQYKQARQRQEDTKSDVSSATNISYLALGSFAVACGALALLPTP